MDVKISNIAIKLEKLWCIFPLFWNCKIRILSALCVLPDIYSLAMWIAKTMSQTIWWTYFPRDDTTVSALGMKLNSCLFNSCKNAWEKEKFSSHGSYWFLAYLPLQIHAISNSIQMWTYISIFTLKRNFSSVILSKVILFPRAAQAYMWHLKSLLSWLSFLYNARSILDSKRCIFSSLIVRISAHVAIVRSL